MCDSSLFTFYPLSVTLCASQSSQAQPTHYSFSAQCSQTLRKHFPFPKRFPLSNECFVHVWETGKKAVFIVKVKTCWMFRPLSLLYSTIKITFWNNLLILLFFSLTLFGLIPPSLPLLRAGDRKRKRETALYCALVSAASRSRISSTDSPTSQFGPLSYHLVCVMHHVFAGQAG